MSVVVERDSRGPALLDELVFGAAKRRLARRAGGAVYQHVEVQKYQAANIKAAENITPDFFNQAFGARLAVRDEISYFPKNRCDFRLAPSNHETGDQPALFGVP
ncbi:MULTISPECIES: hypothetical protein [unclassified Bradyrhizobium]|uniref:hypothetical protein n=1 Tax=unclassified Bradyrhizobium TaxID=2631580 RepID=UPI003D2276C4